jgi:glutathione S-transferase
MKLYMHPASTTSRTVMLFVAESGIALEQQVVDILTGEHHKQPYASMNPNRLVPMLEDGDFRLTECSAILKYLADKIGSPAYPKELKQRAHVNEVMDWINTNFYREWGYHLVYPQLFPHHKRPSDESQKGTLEWGKEQSKVWLGLLNDHWIGPRHAYLCGDRITLADYLGAPYVTIGEIIRCDFGPYPNVRRWLGNMKALKSWAKVNEVFTGFVGAVKEQSFVAL